MLEHATTQGMDELVQRIHTYKQGGGPRPLGVAPPTLRASLSESVSQVEQGPNTSQLY